MHTKIVDHYPSNENSFRMVSKSRFIKKHGSGSLKKAKKLKMAHHSMYIEERVCYEFGWEFQCQPASRVTTGPLIAEGDCSVITETGWFAERLRTLNPYKGEDKYKVAYITFTDENGKVTEGAGIVVSRTSAAFVGKSKLVFALVAEWDGSNWSENRNPC